MNDLRLALRALRKCPGFAGVAVVTLALGIGATTAVFSMVDGVVLRPLALRNAGELVAVRVVVPAWADRFPSVMINAACYEAWKSCPAFAELALLDRFPNESTLIEAGEPERIPSARVSANFFAALGVSTALGRPLTAGDDSPGGARVAVISDRLWRRRFGADPAILGRSVLLDQEECTIVGVLPADFHVPAPNFVHFGRPPAAVPDVFTAKVFSAAERAEIAGRFNFEAIGRLAPGVSAAEAEAQMNVVAARLARQAGGKVEMRSTTMPLRDAVVGNARRGLFLLLGAVGAVLLIGCLNLAILLLVQSERRAHGHAVCAALGAGRSRLVRQAMAEALVIAVAGGLLGVAVAVAGLGLLLQLAPAELPRLAEVRLDARVLAFAAGLTAIGAVLFGVFPVWHLARQEPAALLLHGGRTATTNAAALRLRQVLIGLQIALGTVLLAVVALLTGSFVRVLRAEPGFQATEVLATEIAISEKKYPLPARPGTGARSETATAPTGGEAGAAAAAPRVAFYDRLLENAGAIPGVRAAAIGTVLPLQGEAWINFVAIPERPRPPSELPQTNVRFISGEFFETLGIPMRSGRTFARSDRTRSVVIVSENLAALLWPGEDALGRRLNYGVEGNAEVIGIAADTRVRADAPPVSVLYAPFWVVAPARAMLAVRAGGPTAEPRALTAALRTAIRSTDPEVPVRAMRTMEDFLAESVANRRFQIRLTGLFGISALLLALLGIYGVVAYAVARRTRELGIRAAFGARPRDLRMLVLRQGMAPVAAGLFAGVLGTVASSRILAALLYETSPTDPWLLGGGVLLIGAIALLACWLPARRATRVNPIDALRAE